MKEFKRRATTMVQKKLANILSVLLIFSIINVNEIPILRANINVTSYFKEDDSFLYIGNNLMEIVFYKEDGSIFSIYHKKSGTNLMNNSFQI